MSTDRFSYAEMKELDKAKVTEQFTKALTGLFRNKATNNMGKIIDSLEFQGMDITVTQFQLTQIMNDANGVLHLCNVVAWIIKAGGNVKDNRLSRYSLENEMKAAVEFIGITIKERGVVLAKDAITIGRISAAMHPYIIAQYKRYNGKIRAAANVEFTDYNFGNMTALFHSTFAPYMYDQSSDAKSTVRDALLEWAYQHHNVVNPVDRKSGKRNQAFNRGIFDIKMTSSRVDPSERAEFTKAILAGLDAKNYSKGVVFADAWKEWGAK